MGLCISCTITPKPKKIQNVKKDLVSQLLSIDLVSHLKNNEGLVMHNAIQTRIKPIITEAILIFVLSIISPFNF